MRVHQASFGYAAGHGLLVASIALEGAELRLLEELSDLSGYLERDQSFASYDLGFPCGRFYALLRTWPDPDNPRPGTVYTHALLLAPSEAARLGDPEGLSHLFAFVELARRGGALSALDAEPRAPAPARLAREELTSVLVGWFGHPARPVLASSPAAPRALWARLPEWERPTLSWCTFCLRPRMLGDRPIDLQVVAPGSTGAFGSIARPTGELGLLGELLDVTQAHAAWRRAFEGGFAGVPAAVWLRFLERDRRAASSYPDALAALDLLGVNERRDATQDGTRTRVIDRLLQWSDTPDLARRLADLAVRDLDRVLPGSRARYEATLTAALPTVLWGESRGVEILVSAATRGGFGSQVDATFAESVGDDAARWARFFQLRPEAAERAWGGSGNDQIAQALADDPSLRSTLLRLVPQDDRIWRALGDGPDVVAHALNELAAATSWPADRRLHLPDDALAELVSQGPVPLRGALVAEVGARGRWTGTVPDWLAEGLADVRDYQLRDLLGTSATLRGAIRLPAERWPLLLDATPDAEVLDLTPPPGAERAWADRAATILASDPARVTEERFAHVLDLASPQQARDCLEVVTRYDAPRGVRLLSLAPRVRGDTDTVLVVFTLWGASGADSEPVRGVLSLLVGESARLWETAGGGALAAILERPTAERGALAAEIFPAIHARLVAGREESWLVRQLERFWSGDWDRAGRLRERYAEAWLRGGWPTANLVAAAGGDHELLRRLGREVRYLSGGRGALRARKGLVGDAEWAALE